jgi:hypothetical protein
MGQPVNEQPAARYDPRASDHLRDLASRCDAGADQLDYEAKHAADVLAERAGYPHVDASAWAARKEAGAAAARQYAQDLRTEAAGMDTGDRADAVRVREAEAVADAANLGGILIDGRRGADYAQDKADTIDATGVFEHVNEPGQVPFWQLSGGRMQDVANQSAPEPTAEQSPTEDADEF